MQDMNIIERAFQLASDAISIDEVKKQLRREGYMQVDAHLSGRQIRTEITKRLRGQGKAPPAEETA
jgi:hypothetical protein